MIRICYSEFNSITGISTVTIKTKLGKFTGKTKLHSDDKDYVSNYAGCQYAEMRAIEQYMKARVKIIKERLKGIEICEAAMKNTKGYNDKSIEAKAFRKQKYIMIAEQKKWQNRITSLHDKMYHLMMNRPKTIQEFKTRYNKNK